MIYDKITAYGLMNRHKIAFPDSHFFDHDTLKFFGERLSEMRVLKNTVKVIDYCGVEHSCYVLSSLQRKHPCGPTRAYHYFDVETFELVHNSEV